MIKVKTKWLAVVAVVIMSVVSMATAVAAEMKPFILASMATGNVADKITDVKQSLTENGFEVVGDFSPYDAAHIIVVTNETLKKAAASHPRAGYVAAQRVAITKVGDQIQITYTNPAYMAAAYRVQSDMSSVTAAFAAALGSMKEFGSDDGMSKKELARYNYTFGMEHFDDPYYLASYNSHEKAVAAVEKGLAAKAGGASRIYRIDIPGTEQVLFGMALSSATTNNKFMDDAFIMGKIDFKEIRSTAHLPYEILVTGDEVEALHARFRIAINFPDLSMMGSNSFMSIMQSPDAIKKSLTKVAGGTLEEEW